ncbi:MAG: acetate kinase, partial [Candidatus Methylomirabilales bacterium]
MRVLVLNSGSSSLKFRLLDVDGGLGGEPKPGRMLISGAVKGIGGTATLELSTEGGARRKKTQAVPDHASAIRWVFEHLTSPSQVEAVGHRV